MARKHVVLKALAAAVGSAMLLHSPCASALGLLQAYEAALQNDPQYRAAYFNSESGKENRILGRSNLLPQVSANYSFSQNRTTLSQGKGTRPYDYNSRDATISVRQGLINMDGLARYRQGVAQSKYAEAQFASQQQEVIMRVVSAYLDVLYKQDILALAQVQRDMYVEQRKVNDRMFEKGEGTRTDMLETQARLDQSEAQLLETQDALVTSLDTLSGIVGSEVASIDPLVPDFRVRPEDSASFEEWKQIALDRNPDIQTLRYGVDIAHQEVNKARAGHMPRLDLVGQYGKNSSQSISFFGEDQTVRSIGVQLNVPLYSGGSVSATTRQSVAGESKAKADLEAQTDKVLIDLRKEYKALQSGVARVDALLKSVGSAELLIKATEQSIKGGVRINLDALNAREQLYTSKRDLAQARYNYLLSSLRLRAAAGTLSPDDVRAMAPYFR
jgi:protease secretion system outer membrane protein